MSNPYYIPTGSPVTGSTGASAVMRSEFDAIAAGFDLLPTELPTTYQEGAWTPVAAGSSSSGTLTYTTQVGRYILIGNQVTVWGRIAASGSTGSFTGNSEISGLPFTSSNVSGLEFDGSLVPNAGELAVAVPYSIKLAANAATLVIWSNGTGTAYNANTLYSSADMPTDFSFSLTYRIN